MNGCKCFSMDVNVCSELITKPYSYWQTFLLLFSLYNASLDLNIPVPQETIWRFIGAKNIKKKQKLCEKATSKNVWNTVYLPKENS